MASSKDDHAHADTETPVATHQELANYARESTQAPETEQPKEASRWIYVRSCKATQILDLFYKQ